MYYDRVMTYEDRDLTLAALTVRDVSAYARLLLAVLALIGDDTDAGRTTTCPLRDLAAISGISRRSVQRAIKALEQAGLLARVRRSRQDGGGAPSTYTVLTARLTPEGGPR